MPQTRYSRSVTSKAETVEEYLAEVHLDRRETIEAVRQIILDNLPQGMQETMQYGMIGYSVPHSIYPHGYHCDPKQPLPFAGLASQKNYVSLYLFCIYVDKAAYQRFVAGAEAAKKKLDMGKGCIRFQRVEDLPLDVLAETLREVTAEEFIAQYESTLPEKVRAKRSRSPQP